MRMRKYTRNQVASGIGVLSGALGASSPVLAVTAIWTGDSRWLETGVASLVLAGILYAVGVATYEEGTEQ